MFSKENIAKAQEKLNDKIKIIRYDWYVLVFLLFLSILGIGLTDAFGNWSKWYWLAMIPVFYGCNLFVEWQSSKGKNIQFATIFVRQIQYWLGLFGAIYLTFFLERIGSINNETTGMILLLILALSIFQTGVTTGWLFQLLGVFLGLCLMLVAYVENYIWAIIGLSAVVMVIYFYIPTKFGRSKEF